MVRSISSRWGIAATVPLRFAASSSSHLGMGLSAPCSLTPLKNSTSKLFERTLIFWLLGFPANEIVLPILLMGYLHTGTLTECGGMEALRDILLHSGWTTETALCMMALCLLHFPCGTTCLTIRRETGGYRWTLLAMVLPTAVGIAVCMLIHGAFGLLG